ncbi:MAG TPA: transglycosylase SLT domain-containing protein [Acidobacteriota bacterium]|jgi:soluble lytic murein transglycosylase-like protein/TolA-binding protein|nr:transglycosylase SLT domain-containing protein [Acidobacteriota bacterium]
MRKLLILFCLPFLSGIVLSSFLHLAAQPSDSWPQILLDKGNGNWTSLLARLEALQQSNPESYRLRQADFLKATALERLNRQAEAVSALTSMLNEKSSIKPLILWRLFELAREQDQRDQALRWLQRYKMQISPLADQDEADWQRALLLEKSDSATSQAIYQGLVRRRTRFRRPAQLRWSDSEKNQSTQRRLRVELIFEKKSDEIGYQAAKKLSAVFPALSESEIAAVADVLMLNRDLPAVRKTATYFLSHFPHSQRLPFFNYLLGRAWMLENDHEKAVEQFTNTYDRFPADKWGVQAKYFAAHVYLRMEKYPEAASVYQFVIEKHPDSEWVAGAYSNLVDTLRWQSRWDDARQWAERGMRRLKSSDAAPLAYAEGKIVMFDAPADAIALFEKALQLGERTGLPPSLGKAELHYWIGRCYDRLQNWKAAAASYLESARQDTNYFGFLSRDRLQTLHSEHAEVRAWADASASAAAEAAVGHTSEYREDLRNRYYSAPKPGSDAARSELMASLSKEPAWIAINSTHLWPADQIDDSILRAVSGSQYKRAAAVLAGLGFFHQAADILGDARDFDNTLQQTLTVATFFGYDNYWGEALTEAQKLAVNLPLNTPEFMPRRLSVFFLPLPFSTWSREAAAGLEPELVAAIILRESRFQPDAKSPAGARGLMQLLTSTAKELAREAGLPPPSPEDLYQPSLSVRLGTLYLNKLFRQLQYPEMVVASYNGGSDNVLRWAKKSKVFEPPLFVGDIGFTETKSYTMRVLGNYRLYKILYARG